MNEKTVNEIYIKAAEVRQRIEAAKAAVGRTDEVTVVAAVKTRNAEEIGALLGVGITAIGENRVQELLSKYDSVVGAEWHFIGSLQTNKVKYIVDKVSLIHSVDREGLADEISRRSQAAKKVMDVLVEVNTGGEAAKSGVLSGECENLCAYVAKLPNIRLRGLMGVFPISAPDSLYKSLSELYNGLKTQFGFDVLSMGMSGDYETAVRYGSTMVRIGTGLFGPREYV